MAYKLYEILFLFSLYSVLGRFTSVMAGSLKKEGFRNRSICKGPCQPAFGVGAVTIIEISKIINPNPINMFVIGAIVGTFVEFFSMHIVYQCTKKKNHMRVYHPILFGLGAVLLVLDLNVMIEAIISVTDPLVIMILLLVFWALFPSDIINGLTKNIIKKTEYNK